MNSQIGNTTLSAATCLVFLVFGFIFIVLFWPHLWPILLFWWIRVCVWSSYYECTSHCVVWLKWRSFLIWFIDRTTYIYWMALLGDRMLKSLFCCRCHRHCVWSCFLACSLLALDHFHKIYHSIGAFYRTVFDAWVFLYVMLDIYNGLTDSANSRQNFQQSICILFASFVCSLNSHAILFIARRCRKMVCHHRSDPCVGMWTKVKRELDAISFLKMDASNEWNRSIWW